MFLKKIRDVFTKNKIPFAVVGGFAVAIHGVARGTFDVDVITEISEENFLKIEYALKEIGLRSILPIDAKNFFQNLETFKKEKNIIAWNFINPSLNRDCLDILITEDIRNFEIISAKTDFGSLPVISLEGLIQLKSKSGREQDKIDIAALRKIQ